MEPQLYADSRRVSRFLAAQADPHAVLAAELGPAYAEYRHLWDQARTFQALPPFPLHVDYEMKFACPLACPMCLMSLDEAGRRAHGDPGLELSARTVMDLAAEGAAQGQKSLGFGGLWEPLLAPELPEITAFARGLGLVDVMFNTSGLGLTEKISRALVKSGLTRLMVSLDADSRATYDLMRPGSDFHTVVANIENFLDIRKKMGRRLPLLRLSFCRTALNEAELEPFLARWSGRADFISVQAYGRYPTPRAPAWPRAAWGGDGPAGVCAQPFKRLLVRHNGQVGPCCDASGLGLSLGRLAEGGLTEIWRGEKLAGLRRSLLAEDFSGPAAACGPCQAKFGPRPAAGPSKPC
ncbi:MAG: radical SAM protein [Candidatus Adiutrix sp.]|jgi:MoaA/NifB/PqqE/SkfB family radical SAM enzyme|nr:radical SAM protein [Candidatus Adiutrix sp.]